jgi:FkbM family methyltransferase
VLARVQSGLARLIMSLGDRARQEAIFRSVLDGALSRGPDMAAVAMGGKTREVELFAALHPLMRRHHINYCIDVGAHSGQFGAALYEYLRFEGTCISFEPVACFHEEMTARARPHAGWRTVNAGVSDRAGDGVIHLGEGHGGTSSMLPGTDLLARLASDARLAGRKQAIRLVRLDEHLRSDLENINNRILVKVDTQGSEVSVLESLGAHIGTVSLFVVECAAQALYEGQPLFEDIVRYLREHGFCPAFVANNFGVDSVYYDCDVIFVRSAGH